jgi:hypothetical protein
MNKNSSITKNEVAEKSAGAGKRKLEEPERDN